MPACSKQFTITVEGSTYQITNSSPLAGTASVASAIQLLTSGGTGPHTFSIIAGSLGEGVAMNSSGLIAIMAVTVSARSFTVQAVDSSVPPLVTSKPFVLNIVAANQPAWASLLWGQSTGGGNGSFGPNNAAFASFTGGTTSAPAPTYATAGVRQNTAALTSATPWTGMSRLAISAGRVNSSGSVSVTVTMNGVVVVSYALASDSEVVNLDFSVAGGTSIVVAVYMDSVAGVQGGGGISGSFSNL